MQMRLDYVQQNGGDPTSDQTLVRMYADLLHAMDGRGMYRKESYERAALMVTAENSRPQPLLRTFVSLKQ